MFVLGIDPGLSRCGYGLVRGGGGVASAVGDGPRAVAAGVLTTPVEMDLPCRLALLSVDLRSLLADLRPDVVVVERVFFQRNVRTAMSVGQASGLALAAAATAGIPVVQYTANEVKKAVAGDGSATKEQVASMVVRMTSLGSRPRPADVTDALALALCHLNAVAVADRVERARRRDMTRASVKVPA
jgi:crossover junction endodeoxyribonuclease RuvC